MDEELNNQQEGEGEFFDLFDTAMAPFRGVEGALQGVYNLADYIVDDSLPDWDERWLGESQSTVGSLVESVSQFATGFVPIFGLAGKAGKLAKAGSLTQRALSNNLTRGTAATIVSDFSVFNGQGARLSNLVQQFPELQNPVTEFLAYEDGEGEIEGRLKNVLEGLGLEAATLGFIRGLKGLKKGNKIRQDGGSALDVYRGAVEEMGGDFVKLLPDFLKGGKERVPDSPDVFEAVIESRPQRKPFQTNLEAKRGLEGSRGPDYIKGRLQKKFTVAGADPADVKDIETFIDTIGERMFDDVSMSVTNKIQARGRFNFSNKLLEIRKDVIEAGELKRPMVHELWHSLSRYLPKADADRLTKQFDVERGKFMDDLSKRAKDTNLSPSERLKLAKELNDFKKGNYNDANYRFSDIDEYFAEEMTDAFLSKLDADDALAPSGTFKRAAQEIAILLKDLFASVKSKLGIDQRQKIFNDFIKQRNVKIQRQAPLDMTGKTYADLPELNPEIKKIWSETKADDIDAHRGRVLNIGQIKNTNQIDEIRIAGREWAQVNLPDPGSKSIDEMTTEAFDDIENISPEIAKNWKNQIVDTEAKARELRLEVTIMKQFGRTLSKKALDQAKAYKKNGRSDSDLAKLKNTFQELVEFEAYYSAVGREQSLGLGVRRFTGEYKGKKIGVDESEIETSDGIRNKYLNESGGLSPDKLVKIVEEASDADDVEKTLTSMLKLAKKAQGNKMLDMTQEYWINAILSGPRTHAVNAAGNTLTSLLSTLETAIGGAMDGNIDVVKHAFSSWADWEMIKESWKFSKKAWQEGENQLLPDSKSFDEGRPDAIRAEAFGSLAGKEDTSLYKFVDNLGNFLRLPSRLLLTSDEFFKQMNYRRAARFKLALDGLEAGIKEPYALAKYIEDGLQNVITTGGRHYSEEAIIRKASNQADARGITDTRERTAFIRKYRDENFDEKTNALAAFAKDQTEYLTHTRALKQGSIGRGFQTFTNNHPATKFILPFVRTPSNLLSFSFERLLPWQAGKVLVLKSYREEFKAALKSDNPIIRAQARGKLASGTVMAGIMVDAALNNREYITGGGPLDENQKKALMATGWQPYSFKVGDKYISYQRLDPVGMMVGVIADVVDTGIKSPKAFNSPAYEGMLQALAVTFARNVTNKSYLSGVQMWMDAMSEPERFVPKLLRNYTSSGIPMSGFLGQAQYGSGDQEAREMRSIWEAMKNKTPGLRSTLDPKRNVLGESIIVENVPLIGAINPMAYSTVKDDPILTEMANLRHAFRNPPSTYGGVLDLLDYTNEKGQTAHDRRLELLQSVEVGGVTLRQALSNLINSSNYQNLSPISEPGLESPRVSQITSVLRKFKSAALEQAMSEFPELEQFYDQITRAKYELSMGADHSDVLSLLTTQ